jgi:hypothetical protein
MKTSTILAGVVVALLSSTPARAVTTTIPVTLDGLQAETGSPGTGTATLVLDDVANTLSVSLTYSGLLYPTIDAHIHCCAVPGEDAPIVIPFMPPFVVGSTSGTFDHVFSISDEQEMQVLSGLSYINIHSTVFQNGEIRGQIVVPEPSTLAGIALGLIALSARGWRRAR